MSDLSRALFPGLYEAHFSYVCQSLRRLGVASADLEDLAHEVFMTAYRTLAQIDTARPLRPWLFGIALKLAANHKRKAHHAREAGAPNGEPVDPGPNPERVVTAKQDRELVLRALEGLELERRSVFILYELDGYSMPEIADLLAVPLNTLYSRLRLARAEFVTAVRRLRDPVESHHD